MKSSAYCLLVDRENLDRLFSGSISFEQEGRLLRDLEDLTVISAPKRGEVIAIGWSRRGESTRLPDVIGIPEDEIRETLAWVSTYLKGAAPVSQWCRIIESHRLRAMRESSRRPQYDGLEAAWAGAVIGEVLAHQWQALSDVSLVWCQSSATLAYARTNALWPDERAPQAVLNYMDEARKLLRAESRNEPKGLEDVWRVLASLQRPVNKLGGALSGASRAIMGACRDIIDNGSIGSFASRHLAEFTPLALEVERVDQLNAEDRVRLIDLLEGAIREWESRAGPDERAIASFVIGYIVSRVGAGSANLELLQPFQRWLPLAVVWCSAIAGLHKAQAWSSAFEGLGRLVVRELLQPLHLDQMPSSDVSIDELRALMNPNIQYRRLPFRPASLRAAMIEIMPGVSVAISLSTEARSRSEGGEMAPSVVSPSTERGATAAEELIASIRRIISDYEVEKSASPSGRKTKPKGRPSKLL